MLSRKTLCLASQAPGFTLHDGDDIFLSTVKNHYSSAENDAAEKLMKLKRNVACLSTDQFWRALLPGIADILQAEYITIAKRILPDDPSSVVEMPAIGEPGSCFNAVALYINDGKSQDLVTDYSYLTYGGACAQMRYDKVFLAPHSLAKYMPTRVEEFRVTPESYIGIPLFHQDKCYGHIACVWSDGSSFKNSGLTWGFTEMIFHALEDIIGQRLLEGSTLKPFVEVGKDQQVIPQSAMVIAQSLKPYARSLSHELRTPMQTMVGGMDLIGATLDDILLGSTTKSLDEALKQIQKARDLIEDFQDSSHRAVRAADNVVQAYDLDMQVPEEPSLLEDDVEGMVLDAPVAFVEENSSSYANYSAKRKRDTDSSNEATGIETPAGSDISIPVIRLVQIRGFVRSEVNDLVNHNEVKPISVHNQATELGERLTISLMDPTGGTIHKTIEWEVQSSVPTDIMIEEKELSKTFTAIIANALKFTSDGGQVKIDIRLSPKLRYFVFTVRDNGCGIPDSFQPRIFQAFSREDESITRHNEGLGLGLLVAKGNARKIGGDLYLVKSSTTGPDKGSHFELKIPICPFDSYARQETSSSRLGTPDKISTKDLKLILHENIPQLLTPGSPTERFTSTRGRQSFDRELGKKYPHKILVAEDSSLNRRLVVTMLAKMGYDHVLEAFDGKEAVRLMEDNEEIDLILMDLWMPNMDGYEATERIIAMDKKKNRGLLKILAVTADITDAALGRAKEVGMVGYMTKPFKVIELERLIIVHSSEP